MVFDKIGSNSVHSLQPFRLTLFAHGFQPVLSAIEGLMVIAESNVLSDRSESKDNMNFFFYILKSSDNKLYIGQTNNLQNRENQQINKTKKAAKFIKDGGKFELVYSEEYKTRLEAMRREKQLKGWTRSKKEALISGNLELLKKL